MLGLVLGFDMDGHHGVGHLDPDLVLNPVTDIVSIRNRRLSRHHEMEIDRGCASGMTRPKVVCFKRSGGLL